MNNNKHCRGFECVYYTPSSNGKLRFVDCKRPGKHRSLTGNEYEICSECDVLNDCTVCFHKRTCKYVHRAKILTLNNGHAIVEKLKSTQFTEDFAVLKEVESIATDITISDKAISKNSEIIVDMFDKIK